MDCKGIFFCLAVSLLGCGHSTAGERFSGITWLIILHDSWLPLSQNGSGTVEISHSAFACDACLSSNASLSSESHLNFALLCVSCRNGAVSEEYPGVNFDRYCHA